MPMPVSETANSTKLLPLLDPSIAGRRTGSAGHAGATANLKLTFHLDHSAGADHYSASICPAVGICCPGRCPKAEAPNAVAGKLMKYQEMTQWWFAGSAPTASGCRETPRCAR